MNYISIYRERILTVFNLNRHYYFDLRYSEGSSCLYIYISGLQSLSKVMSLVFSVHS